MGDSAKVALVVLCFLMAGCSGSDDSEILGTEYRDPHKAPDFTLEKKFGDDLSLSDF